MYEAGNENKDNVPVNITIVLPPRRILATQLDAGKYTFLASYGADKLDDAVHGAGHVDDIADGELSAVTAEHSAVG
jgi:hypothetical protein